MSWDHPDNVIFPITCKKAEPKDYIVLFFQEQFVSLGNANFCEVLKMMVSSNVSCDVYFRGHVVQAKPVLESSFLSKGIPAHRSCKSLTFQELGKLGELMIRDHHPLVGWAWGILKIEFPYHNFSPSKVRSSGNDGCTYLNPPRV